MASLNYDGKKINFAVENIIKVSNEFETLSDTIKRSTTKIVSAKGFNEYIGGITGDTFKGYTTDCKSLIDQLVQNVREMQIKVLAFSQDKNEINAFLDTLDRLDYKNLDLSAIDDYISFGRKAKLFASGILADVGAAGLGVVEGVGEFLETGADLLDMGATAIFSVFTLGYDVITGENTTEKMWEETKARVSEKKVESAFNRFYNETELGQAIKNNAYGFETVRSIGKGIGYSAGIIALNVFTGGLASGAGILSAGSVGVGQLAVTAGVMAISSGSEEAWADGATLGEGLVYGLANGAWESAQWAIGAKIGQIGGWGDKIATNVLKSAGKGSLTRIGLDTVDSGLEGFVQPALTMIYKDYEGETFAEKYNKAFETSGGWKNVLTQASLGGLMSSAGERMDARKLLKSKETDAKIESKSKTKTDVEIEKLSTDVESSSKLATQAAAGKKVETNTKTASDPNYKPEKTTKTETKTATQAASGQKIETNTKAASDPSYNSGKPAQTETKATTPAASGQKIETNTKTASDSSYKPEKTTKTETKTTTPATSGQKVETNTKTASNSSYNSGKPAQTETKTATQTTAGKNTNTNPQKVDTPNYNTSEYRLQKDQIVQDSIGNKTKTVSVSSDMKSETNITGNSKSVKNNVEISTTGQNPAMANVVTATTAATPVISTVELYKNGKVSADYGNYKLNNLVEDTKVVTPAVDAKLADINTKTANDLNYKKNAPAQEDVSVKAAPDKKVQMIEKTPSEPSGNYRDYGITENDTIGDMAKKLDKAVEEGKLTRAQADEMFEKAGEELKVVQKEQIESLKAENESLMADRKANIEEKELLIKEDGAKRENVRGHDEAVRQIDEMIAQNKEQIAAYEKEVSTPSPETTPREVKPVEQTPEVITKPTQEEGKRVDPSAKAVDESGYQPRRLAEEGKRVDSSAKAVDETGYQPRRLAEEGKRVDPSAKAVDEAGYQPKRLAEEGKQVDPIIENIGVHNYKESEYHLRKDQVVQDDLAKKTYDVNSQNEYHYVRPEENLTGNSYKKMTDAEIAAARKNIGEYDPKQNAAMTKEVDQMLTGNQDVMNYKESEYHLRKDQVVQDDLAKKTYDVNSQNEYHYVRPEENLTGNSYKKMTDAEIEASRKNIGEYDPKQNAAMTNVVDQMLEGNQDVTNYKSSEYHLRKDQIVQDDLATSQKIDSQNNNINHSTQEEVKVKTAAEEKVPTIEKTSPSESSGNYRDYGITENDTLGDIARKLDQAVEEGKLTRSQADEMFETAGEELKVVQKEQIAAYEKEVSTPSLESTPREVKPVEQTPEVVAKPAQEEVNVKAVQDEKVPTIEKSSPSEPSGNYRDYGITENDTIGDMAKKLDKTVEEGKLTRAQADEMFEKAGEELKVVQKEQIESLKAENESLMADRKANIEEKELLIKEDGAKRENVRGHDEAVRQIDEMIAQNKEQIAAYEKEVSTPSPESTPREVKPVEQPPELITKPAQEDVSVKAAPDEKVQMIEKTPSETSGNYRDYGITENDTIGDMAKKLDKAVEDGKLTRAQADEMFEKAGEELKVVQKEQIESLKAENESLMADRKANIEEKELLIKEDGAKRENVRGHDEAVRQIDEMIAQNKEQIAAYEKEIKSQKIEESKRVSSEEIKSISNEKVKDLSAQNERFKVQEDTKNASVEKTRINAEEDARVKVEEEARVKAEEEARVKAEEEARVKAEEEARVKAEEEARVKAEEEARVKAEEETRIKAEEEARVKAEEEARIKAEEEARVKAEEEARVKVEEEARIKAEEEARVKAEEEARIKAEEDARVKAEEEARVKAEEEARVKAEEEARIKAEEEARVKAEEEARIKAEEEARVKAEEEARIKAEEEAKVKAEEDARVKAEEEARIKAEEEARIKAENVFSHENNIDGEIHRKVGSQENEKLSKSFKEDIVSDYNYEKRYSLTPQELEIANKVCAKINAGEAVRLNGNNARFSSAALRYIRDNADPSKCNVIIDSAFRGMDGQYKSKYAKTRYAVRTNFNLSEAISIMSKLEELRARVDMSLPRVERAKQIYEMVAKEFSYCHDYGGHHSVVASLKGITSNNILGKPGIVCAGYAQVYKNLCDMCNVPCDYIRGKSRGETHAWNVVFDDNGNAIPVDCTWKSGNPGADYFGRSKKFATDHVADADEVYRDYMPNASEINASVVDSKETIDKAISTMNYKFGQGEGLKRIKRFYETGDINQITRTDGCRTEIASMTREDILTYLVQNDIQSSHRMLDKIGDYMTSKYGARYNKIATLKAYLSGNSQVITRDHNYRTIMDSMPKEFILDYLRKL